jgi:signal transduction histidine kinase
MDGGGRFAGYRGSAFRLESAADTEAIAEADPFGARLERALREPLTRIIGDAEQMSAREHGPMRREYADYSEDIANAGRHLLGLVGDLVDLQAIERADFRPKAATIDLAEVARRAAALLKMRGTDREVTIDPPAPDETMPAIGDDGRVLQILVNLVGNAVRHSPPGGAVWLRTDRRNGSAMVVVADQGDGIAPEDQQRIFEKFTRLDHADGAGSGLGLYIARRLARAMGGDIAVDSAPGQGARFILSVPA